jgi:hypothetical protein
MSRNNSDIVPSGRFQASVRVRHRQPCQLRRHAPEAADGALDEAGGVEPDRPASPGLPGYPSARAAGPYGLTEVGEGDAFGSTYLMYPNP